MVPDSPGGGFAAGFGIVTVATPDHRTAGVDAVDVVTTALKAPSPFHSHPASNRNRADDATPGFELHDKSWGLGPARQVATPPVVVVAQRGLGFRDGDLPCLSGRFFFLRPISDGHETRETGRIRN